jgi:putative pyrogenic exotoxin B
MKKLSIIAALVMAGCCLTGCVSNQDMPPAPVAETNTDSGTNPYRISEEEALANLDAFFAANSGGNTRTSAPAPRVKNLIGIRNNDKATRGEAEDTTTLLYVANFENQQGFALLAADKRIDTPVIGVSEQGEISEDAIARYEATYGKRPLYKGFPLDGPGFFTDTVPGGGTETFINPNTVDFYIEEEGEYLIGDFDTSGYEPLNTMNSSTTPNDELETYIVGSSIDYARNNINDNKVNDNHMRDPRGLDGVEIGEGGSGPTDQIEETDVVIVGPLLSDFVYWRQVGNLNKYFPLAHDPLTLGIVQAATGCYPLALAKILAHNRRPEVFTYHGHTFDWNIISNDRSGSSDEAAFFLRAVADGCNPWYFASGTFVFPKRAARFLKRNEYTNVDNKKYSFDRIKGMIDNNRPLAICGMPDRWIFRAHAWNIDGYRTSKYGSKEVKMIHCDFGWGGNYNGYYVDNCFNLGSDDNIYDGRHENDDRTLNSYNRLLMYE